MARPKKNNLDFFRHEKVMRNDPKIRAARLKFGNYEGYAIYAMLLEYLCDQENLRFELNEDNLTLLSIDFGADPDRLKEMLNYFIKPLDLIQLENGFVVCRQLTNKHMDVFVERHRVRFVRGETEFVHGETEIVPVQTELPSRVKKSIEEKSIEQKSIKDTWRTNAVLYYQSENEAYEKLLNDSSWISEQQRFNPSLNIKLSLEKAHTQFWGTEAGWKHKKKSRSVELNWKSTYEKALSQRINQVWLPRYNETKGTQISLGGRPD
jgi:hypothetical protein